MTKILDERYKQIVDNELLNIFNTLSTSINTKANSSDVYTKLETDEQIRLKVAEIVASAPEDFDTLKEISDWLNTHAESAAAMNVQIQDNTTKITKLQSGIQSQSTTIGTHENKISVLTNNVSSLSTGLSAATQNISNAQADIDNNSDDISTLKERVTINKTTLGYQRKNLFNWKSATWLNPSGSVTVTKKAESITIKSLNTWASATYKLPELEVGIPYTFSTVISDFAKAEGAKDTGVKIRLSYDTGGTKPIEDINISADGAYEVTFTPSSKTAYIIFYPNYSGTVYENTYTASELMLRYASITDGTYESYKLTVGEHIAESEADIVVARSDAAVGNTTLGYQKKNILKPTCATTTKSGVTFIVNEDGSITVSGANTSDEAIWFFIAGTHDVKLPIFEVGKKYIVTGTPEDNLDNNGKRRAYMRVEKSGGIIAYDIYGTGVELDVTDSVYPEYVDIYVAANADYTDKPVTFYPMIRDAAITDDTYEPYVESVDERLSTLEQYHTNISTDTDIVCRFSCADESGQAVSASWLKSYESRYVHIQIGCITGHDDEPYMWSNHLVRLPKKGSVPMSSGIMLADEGITGYIVIFWDCTNGTAEITGVNTSLKDKYTTIKATITPLAIAAM